ncbi:hypothetical protein DI270_034330 [Microbispora triticiradicis]|uniref:Uncharacterized protein n=1 Tax=Microbispora triticiradicis TaxID=2200763 RepID=A0ABX9LB99_9ACTN|nr:hypothetical protein DI270_034330 [Microbispora triticiradicis]
MALPASALMSARACSIVPLRPPMLLRPLRLEPRHSRENDELGNCSRTVIERLEGRAATIGAAIGISDIGMPDIGISDIGMPAGRADVEIACGIAARVAGSSGTAIVEMAGTSATVLSEGSRTVV